MESVTLSVLPEPGVLTPSSMNSAISVPLFGGCAPHNRLPGGTRASGQSLLECVSRYISLRATYNVFQALHSSIHLCVPT